MMCPKCASDNHRVDRTIQGEEITRIRQCKKCYFLWFTKESISKNKTVDEYVEYMQSTSEKKNA